MSNGTIPFNCFRVARITKRRSKLSLDIWVDDTGVSKKGEYPLALIWFSKKEASGKQRMISMSVSENPQVFSGGNCAFGFSEWEKVEMVLFVRANRVGLLRLANPCDDYDVVDFIKDMKTGDDIYDDLYRDIVLKDYKRKDR